MSNTSVEIPDFSSEDFLFVPGQKNCTETTVLVKPPIVVGELFEQTILGANPLELGLKHVVSTEDATVLEARVGGTRDKQERVEVIKEIASRITILVAFPEEATLMRKANPFTQRYVSVAMRQADLKSTLRCQSNQA